MFKEYHVCLYRKGFNKLWDNSKIRLAMFLAKTNLFKEVNIYEIKDNKLAHYKTLKA